LILRVALLWFSILAVPVSGAIDFAGLPVEDKMLLAAFTALQAVAACGLWLLASWGPVVFILLTMLETASALGFLGTLRAPLALCIVDAGLVAIYLGLSIAAARQQRRRRI
ncbi:MAG: hypothetical protein KDI98_08660, partial [Hyphomicrobiaceae bacterium]|nr:hypothetical protein [Hyphomicrobiaceae bacterium]